MSERPLDVPPAVPPEPRPSALGIVVRPAEGGGFEMLVGKRSADARFMPGHLAFPGGRLEKRDGAAGSDAYARCVAREILEETGIAIDAGAWLDAGERTTPPIFPVRFHTKFFVARMPDGARLPDEPPQPHEVAWLGFVDAETLLSDWEESRVLIPPPLLPILRLAAAEPGLSPELFAARIGALNAVEQELSRVEFVPGIWMLPVATATLPPASHTNVWMPGARRFVVIDPGSDDPVEIERLDRLVRRREAEGARRLSILLTHHHRDHVSGAATLARVLDVPVLAHAATLDRLGSTFSDVRVDVLEDDAVVDLDGASLRALHTPGHAPGHVAFHHVERNALIAGDLVSGLSTILIGLADGDMDAYLDSLARVRDLRVRQVLAAHGPPLPARVLGETIAHRQAREASVLAALGGGRPRSLEAIAAAAYADTPQAPPFLRELQARAHLERLARGGRVCRSLDAGTWERTG